MIMVTSKFNMTFPKFEFQKDLEVVARDIIITRMNDYMNAQTTIHGTPYPPLEPETIARKSGATIKRLFTKKGTVRETASKTIEKAGLGSFSNRTLFETGKLFRSFKYKKKGKSSVVIYLNSERHDVGKALAVDGVGRKRKKFDFFGISKFMEADAMDYMKKRISEEIGRRGTR